MSRLASLLHHPKPLRFLLAQIFWRTGWGRRMKFPLRAFRLHLHPANLAWQLWVDRHQRDADMQLIRDLLKPGDTMIDVGANIGFTAIEGAQAVGVNGVVHAIEPHPRIHQWLKENLALNQMAPPQVQCHAVAVGEAASEKGGLLTDSRRDDMNFVIAPGCERHSSMNQKGITVPVSTLDVMFSDLPRCDLLKIDVEGAELAVLRGASRLLKSTSKVLIEAGDPNSVRHGSSADELLAHLETAGFEVSNADQDDKGGTPINIENYRRHVGNWLAMRR
ncbi:FkbM family methyltransferase [Prosthecobacter fluviatilis]|uniref:FkbM family methyltransferase n=1 Tax=Prosthecobacter fluviatilis TaxID=445931 RepID=A0ABW0KRS1_9BACT